MHEGLLKWHSAWCSKNVTEADQRAATNWFMGNIDGLRPNCTKKVHINNPGRPPFTPYNKYKCEMTDSGSNL